ncbi:MAG: neutral zinc metallopeptidase [Terriglobia bacterium]
MPSPMQLPGGSGNDIEDRRDEEGGGGGGGGIGGIHLGIGGTIIVGLLSLVFHQNLFQMFSGEPTAAVPSGQHDTARDAREQPEVNTVSSVLDDVQGTWDKTLIAQQNRQYHHAKLVLYRDQTNSSCGTAQTATGPFYCPEDEKVYLDLGFFDELRSRFGAPGEFAQAYVIAHEIGHHVQKILGIEQKVRQLQQREPGEVNPLSVRLELQADCFAGVWANSTEQRGLIGDADVKSAMGAAAAVGDDRLQKASRGTVNPETFTHGSSAQRVSWFQKGFESGKVGSCNTFSQ